MSLYIASLNSGSNGNCYYVGNGREAVLVDAGISCREIERRMDKLQLSMQHIKSVFISHEHIDHIRGVELLSKKYNLPVYISPATLKHSRIVLDKRLICNFNSDESVAIGALEIIPFSKHHDAADPFSFLIQGNDIKIGVITDIGKACKQVIHYFKQCHACFLESNYDEHMLEKGDYPLHLKNRIRGGNGHLSNREALQLFMEHRPAFMNHLILSHLSKNNNDAQLVYDLFSKHAGHTNIVVASRYKETSVFKISHSGFISALKIQNKKPTGVQLSLFG